MLYSKSGSAALRGHDSGHGRSSTLVVLANGIVPNQKSATLFGNSRSFRSYLGGARCADILVFYDVSFFFKKLPEQNKSKSLLLSGNVHPKLIQTQPKTVQVQVLMQGSTDRCRVYKFGSILLGYVSRVSEHIRTYPGCVPKKSGYK